MKKITWYLSVWFIALLSFLSYSFIPLLLVVVVLVFIHAKRLKVITELANQLENLKKNGFEESIELSILINRQNAELRELEKQLSSKQEEFDKQFITKQKEFEKLNENLTKAKEELIEMDELVLMQNFGFYNPKYNLEDSQMFKNRLDQLRASQKEMVRNKEAAVYNNNWTVDGSKSKGTKMVNDAVNLAIRSFNNECDVTIAKVTIANVHASEKRIRKAFETINRLNQVTGTAIRHQYLTYKLEELYLALEYAQKVEEEKEEQRQIREQMREEEKVRREIEKLKEKVTKEEKHFIQAISNLEVQKENADDEQLTELENKILELQSKLNEVLSQKEDVVNRERNTRAGYVYIISNIGSFGEEVYKIGMTRRLEPMDRVRELGDASVPFKFDVHALIFSEDAPTLENTLHKTFNHRRLNLINTRREFFKVTLEEIQEVVKNNHDKTIEFTVTALADEYRESESIRNKVIEQELILS